MSQHLRIFIAIGALGCLAVAGCSDRNPAELEIARALDDPIVFDDDYGPDIWYEPFSDTHYTAVTLDSVHAYQGSGHEGARSLKFHIPPAGSALGGYTGGVLRTATSRDLTDYNALTFRARTNVTGVNLNEAGFGNDNTGTSLYDVSRGTIPIGTDWTYVVVPIPNPDRLIAERGLFLFAEAPEITHPNGYDIWIDDIRFAQVDGLSVNLTFLGSSIRRYFVGTTVGLAAGTTRFDSPQGPIQIGHSSRYFDLISSDPSVALPVERSGLKSVSEGTATITASLTGMGAGGQIIVHTHEPPDVAAPHPTLPDDRVISMFSDAYDDLRDLNWEVDWSDGVSRDYRLADQNTKMLYDFNYVAVDFIESPIDASNMNYFHVDVYAPFGEAFIVKLVSFPEDLEGSSLETAVTFNANTSPTFTAGEWSSLDIDLDTFPVPGGWDWSRIGILIFQRELLDYQFQLVLVDNVYWYK